jgi:hypothetical protein
VTVIGGHEEESESGVITLDDDLLTGLIRGFDCAGNLINDAAPAQPTSRPRPRCSRRASPARSLRAAAGTVTVDMTWEGIGPRETTSNTTTSQASPATSPASGATPWRPAGWWSTAKRS